MTGELELAKKFFYDKNYSNAKNIFLDCGFLYEAGLCDFLTNNIEFARKKWQNCKDNLFASKWGLITLELIAKKTPEEDPKYFQIRAFYEVYLSLLIENNMFEYAETLINSFEYLTRFNLEVPKFISRVLHAYGYDDPALRFVDISMQENYVDVEALYIASQIYLKRGEKDKALEYTEKMLLTAPTYYPAIQLKKLLV